MTSPRRDDDPRVRFRVWVAAQLVDEAWVDVGNPDAQRIADTIRDRHHAIVGRAIVRDLPWMVEVYDPAMPDHRAYLRAGTDAAGMVDPRPVSGS